MSKQAHLRKICEESTYLSEEEILFLEEKSLELTEQYRDSEKDLFIDVFNRQKKNALVIFHKTPTTKPSLYQDDVVGEMALFENEPGVLRTMETGMASRDLIAVSQEGKVISQNVQPIIFENQVIAAIVEEEMIEENESKEPADIPYFFQIDNMIIDQLEESIMVFDREGALINYNRSVETLYKKIGYRNQLFYMHFNDLTLTHVSFQEIKEDLERQEGDKVTFSEEVHYFDYYFILKYIWVKSEERLVLILNDNTKNRKIEQENISKSVAIKEIHHRVKNNLQSIVSLLQVQRRRVRSDEARNVLRESIARMMVIASSHDLLSKRVDSEISLAETLDEIYRNFITLFSDTRMMRFDLSIDPTIMLRSDEMVTISLVINELVQNIYDHAYEPGTVGYIHVLGEKIGPFTHLMIEDHGKGYSVEDAMKNSLGLMIVDRYVKDKLKGKIEIHSDENGTKVSIYF